MSGNGPNTGDRRRDAERLGDTDAQFTVPPAQSDEALSGDIKSGATPLDPNMPHEELVRLLNEADANGTDASELLALAESRLGELTPVQIAAMRALHKERFEEARAEHGKLFTREDIKQMVAEVEDRKSTRKD